MPTVLAGTALDIQLAPEKIVRDLIKYRWPEIQTGAIPPKDAITFALLGWAGRKSFQISIEPAGAPIITPLSVGEPLLYRYVDPMIIHVWILKNSDEVPDSIHSVTQKTEQIINENMTNVGYGITSIQLTSPFSAIEQTSGGLFNSGSGFLNQTEMSLWHSTAVVELLYFKYITRLSGVTSTKTHKFDIE